jgi:hypothetical protein
MLILMFTYVCLPESPAILKVNKAFSPRYPTSELTAVVNDDTYILVHVAIVVVKLA